MGWCWHLICKYPFENNFSSLRSSSMLSANMRLKIRGIFHIGVLVLNFSSILKVILISTFFVHINLSFMKLVFLDSSSNFDNFWFLNLKNPFTQSKVTAKFVISFKLQFPGVYNGMSQCPFPQKSSANYENSWRTLFRERAICTWRKSLTRFSIFVYTPPRCIHIYKDAKPCAGAS